MPGRIVQTSKISHRFASVQNPNFESTGLVEEFGHHVFCLNIGNFSKLENSLQIPQKVRSIIQGSDEIYDEKFMIRLDFELFLSKKFETF